MIMKDNLPRHFFRNRMYKIKETHQHIMAYYDIHNLRYYHHLSVTIQKRDELK